MKTGMLRFGGFTFAILLFSSIISISPAQQRQNMRFRTADRPAQGRPMRNLAANELKLTEDQQKQMEELRTRFEAESRKTNNLIREKRAHLKTLADIENRDMKDLDKTIADLTNLQGEKIKQGIAHRDEVKKVLTPDQMKMWEMKAQGARHKAQGRMREQGTRRGGHGPGFGAGRGMMRGEGRMMQDR